MWELCNVVDYRSVLYGALYVSSKPPYWSNLRKCFETLAQWSSVSLHCVDIWVSATLWQVDGTASERWRKSAEWREVDRFSQRHFSEWRGLDRLSASNRLNILSLGSSIYTELPDRKETGLAEIKPERVDWESVRSALAEQLRYNLRSPHYHLYFFYWCLLKVNKILKWNR